MTAITEFIQQLREFGTGAYLRPEERQYWEPPFDVNALPELEALLIGYAKSVPLDVPNPDIIHDHAADHVPDFADLDASTSE